MKSTTNPSEGDRPIEWDPAFELVAGELHALGSPDKAVFYTSSRTSDEAAFLVGR
jgi:predicted molibdopterin-dependent oxidoreductase YjgC